jgi:hypothetical protein
MPKLAKVHATEMAKEFIRLGWTVKYQFQNDGKDEPYEYVLEWLRDGNSIYPPWPPG